MDISIVIPCYNHGHFIQDAIDSVEDLTGVDYEIIIVDDGSDDAFTIQKLGELKKQDYKIISHTNRGLAYTRNIGIRNASGRFILPLDADNKIKPEYVYKALHVFKEKKVDVVYARPIFFGENNNGRNFETKSFKGTDLFHSNFIDACAIFSKSLWCGVGGYDENMPVQGHEDWEYWLNAYINGFNFHFIDEELYHYRIVSGSMIEAIFDLNTYNKNFEYILRKHALAYISRFNYYRHMIDNFEMLEAVYKVNQRDREFPLRATLKYFHLFLNKLFRSLSNVK
jgi:glycosyltransferase involved in cell wall biosynthesis